MGGELCPCVPMQLTLSNLLSFPCMKLWSFGLEIKATISMKSIFYYNL